MVLYGRTRMILLPDPQCIRRRHRIVKSQSESLLAQTRDWYHVRKLRYYLAYTCSNFYTTCATILLSTSHVSLYSQLPEGRSADQYLPVSTLVPIPQFLVFMVVSYDVACICDHPMEAPMYTDCFCFRYQ